MAKRVTLAVAGSRKTQGIVEHCAGLPAARRVLALTYTQKNQQELQDRLARRWRPPEHRGARLVHVSPTAFR
jgi:superfamily I DNA/RNA helicase